MYGAVAWSVDFGPLSALIASAFDAAADWWEAAILDDYTLTIDYAWSPLSGGTLGVHNLILEGGTPNRESLGIIRFDSDLSSTWFIDPTPHENSEFLTFTETELDLGGGLMNVGRVFTDPTGDAVGRFDLLSVAKHEIGHALGLSGDNTAFQLEIMGDGDIDIVGGALDGAVLSTVSGAHLDLTSALMFPTFGTGIRRIQSAVDILANCQISQFTNCVLDPVHEVPAPGALSLFVVGLAGLGFMARRRRLAA